VIVCLIAVASTPLVAGVRWTNPAGSHYVDGPDTATARGAFVRHGALFSLEIVDQQFRVSAWNTKSRSWTAWSRVSNGAPVQGDMDHVTIEGPGEVRALVDAGGAPEGDDIRRCEWWSVTIDDSVRAVSWSFRGREEHDLNSISNYGAEAEAYFGRLNAERLHQPSSPARIVESYVQGSAAKEAAVAFGVGNGLHVYALQDRANGDRASQRCAHEAPTPTSECAIGRDPRRPMRGGGCRRKRRPHHPLIPDTNESLQGGARCRQSRVDHPPTRSPGPISAGSAGGPP